MSTTQNLPTAELLGKYRKELQEQGMPDHLIEDLVRQASHDLLTEDGLAVKGEAKDV